jgi:hypothetical protein
MGLFHEPKFVLLSIQMNLRQTAAVLMGAKPQFDVPWVYSALILAAIAGFAAFVLHKKIRGAEVIR